MMPIMDSPENFDIDVQKSPTRTRQPFKNRLENCIQYFRDQTRKLKFKHNPLPPHATRLQWLRWVFLCPPHGPLAIFLTKALIWIFAWLTALSLRKEEALPGGNVFALMSLILAALTFGYLASLIRLPPLLGMLIAGSILKNVPKIDFARNIDPNWSSILRNVALTVILTRAGLGLDGRALRKLSKNVILLAVVPCFVEAAAVGISAKLILGFPWLWGFLLGFVQAAVSPAVLVPFMLNLQEMKLGTNKGIPTLVIAASSLDDVFAISGFSVLLSVIFTTGRKMWVQLLQGPLELGGGLLYGIFVGVMFWYLPHRHHEDVSALRFIFLFAAGLVGIFGSKAVDFSGAGALGCLTAAFVSAHRWRTPGWDIERVKTSVVFAYLWTFFQPLLFGLIGAEVDLQKVRIETVGLAIAVLIIGLTVRMAATMVAVTGAGLNMKEKFFTAIAWIPKATVQAALGPLALDRARDLAFPNPEYVHLGEQVVTIAVLLIIITAPLGAIGIALSSQKLLEQEPVTSEDQEARENLTVVHRNGLISAHDHAEITRMIDETENTH